jgi:hypothetical protein
LGMVLSQYRFLYTLAVPQELPDRGGASIPSWSILNLYGFSKEATMRQSQDIPFLAASIAGFEVASALVHPDHDRSLLMCPLFPNSLDFTASSDRRREVGGCATVAHDLPIGDGHGRVVVGPLSLDRLRARGWCEAFVPAKVNTAMGEAERANAYPG